MNERDQIDRRLDDELAAMTDSFLQDRQTSSAALADELQGCDDIVRGLHALLAEPQPSESFQARMRQRLDAEWTRRPATRPAGSMRFSPVMRMAAVAALVVLSVGLLALFAPPDTNLQGTAVGEFGAGILVGVGLVGAGVVIGYIILRRRK